MAHDVRLEQRGSRPLAVVRRLASQQQLSKVVPEACGTVWNVLRSQQVSGAGRHVAVYLDGQINLEVGVELVAALPCEPSGKHAPGRCSRFWRFYRPARNESGPDGAASESVRWLAETSRIELRRAVSKL